MSSFEPEHPAQDRVIADRLRSLTAENVALRARLADALRRAEENGERANRAETLAAEIQATKSFRMLERPRAVYRRLRPVIDRLRRRTRSGKASASAEPLGQVPIIVIVRDRLSCLTQLITWLESIGQRNIVLFDNASSYPPLLEYLATTRYEVVRSEHNLGHRGPWLAGVVARVQSGFYVVTDPDVIPCEGCPPDALERFHDLLVRHPHVAKAGFGLLIDDLPAHYALRDDVIHWESQFWQLEVEPGVYQAPIDTTFALYRPGPTDFEPTCLRTAAPYVARHLPWYIDSADPSDEDRYYREHADPGISNWDRDLPPVWKAAAPESSPGNS